MSNFFFDGKAASDFGLVVEYYPRRKAGKKRVETVTVPGRTGTLTLFQKSQTFENSTRSYQVYFKSSGGTTAKSREIFQWLMGAKGYSRLSDTYDSDVFWLARYVAAPDAEIIFNRFGRMTVEFDIDPRAFLTDGETPFVISAGETITNDWMESKPLLYITANGAGTIMIGDQTIEILAEPPGDIYIDSESGRIYNGTTDLAHYVSMQDFPTIPQGETVVQIEGDINELEITPRWWQP